MEVKIMEEKAVVQQRPRKSPGFAGVLGIFPFGVGALYNGQYTKALLQLIIFAGLIHMQDRGGGQPFMGLLLAGFIVYQFFDNIQSAKAINAAAAGQAPAGAADQGLPEFTASGSIFWGTVLIVLGVVLILANFEVILYETLFDLWPIAVIVLGLKLVYDSVRKSKNGK
jgi:hypothetical protein